MMEESKPDWIRFIPQALLAAGLVIWTVFQMVMLVTEGNTLRTLIANQENVVQQAVKLRAQLDSIAAKTAILAEQGNSGAKTIVEQLRKRGVTINPNANAPKK